MSLQKIKQVFDKLSNCTMWSLQLLNAREVHGEFVYNAHDIVVTTSDAIIEFIRELELTYTKEKGRLSNIKWFVIMMEVLKEIEYIRLNFQVNLSVTLVKNLYMLWQIQI